MSYIIEIYHQNDIYRNFQFHKSIIIIQLCAVVAVGLLLLRPPSNLILVILYVINFGSMPYLLSQFDIIIIFILMKMY